MSRRENVALAAIPAEAASANRIAAGTAGDRPHFWRPSARPSLPLPAVEPPLQLQRRRMVCVRPTCRGHARYAVLRPACHPATAPFVARQQRGPPGAPGRWPVAQTQPVALSAHRIAWPAWGVQPLGQTVVRESQSFDPSIATSQMKLASDPTVPRRLAGRRAIPAAAVSAAVQQGASASYTTQRQTAAVAAAAATAVAVVAQLAVAVVAAAVAAVVATGGCHPDCWLQELPARQNTPVADTAASSAPPRAPSMLSALLRASHTSGTETACIAVQARAHQAPHARQRPCKAAHLLWRGHRSTLRRRRACVRHVRRRRIWQPIEAHH